MHDMGGSFSSSTRMITYPGLARSPAEPELSPLDKARGVLNDEPQERSR